jgi:3-oxoadipate CoA-transferase alpha subunit
VPINKVADSLDEAVADISDGATILVGGFGGPGGYPSYLIRAVARRNVSNLTVVANSTGLGREIRLKMTTLMSPPDWFYEISLLVEQRQVKKAIASFPVSASPLMVTPFERQLRAGEVEIEMVPQGTLAERIRAAKAGIPAFYTPTGPGTVIAEGKEIRYFNGKPCLLEHALRADFALIRALKADRYGNLVYRGTSRSFNATMAGAAEVTIAEVDEVVELGELDPEAIVTSGVYVDRVAVRPKEA